MPPAKGWTLCVRKLEAWAPWAFRVPVANVFLVWEIRNGPMQAS